MKNTLLILITFSVFGCTNNQDRTEIISLTQEIEKLNAENEELGKTIELLKYPASDRIKQIKELVVNNNFIKAKDEISQLRTLFPESSEVQECVVQERIMEEKQDKIKAEEERIKALGFKALKEVSKVEVEYNKISIGAFSVSKTFVFDSYEERYFYRTADRGNIYVSARIYVTSSSKNPRLPVFYAYRISGDNLISVGSFKLEFARWEDYATYLGNYSDNSNDFSKTSTIPFKIGLEVSDEIAASPLVIICHKVNCMTRKNDRYRNPPVSYTAVDKCFYKATLMMDDLKQDYEVVKFLNKNKL